MEKSGSNVNLAAGLAPAFGSPAKPRILARRKYREPRTIVEQGMRPDRVVVASPGFDDDLGFAQRGRQSPPWEGPMSAPGLGCVETRANEDPWKRILHCPTSEDIASIVNRLIDEFENGFLLDSLFSKLLHSQVTSRSEQISDHASVPPH